MDASLVAIWLSFGLLGMSICAVWVSPTRATRHAAWMPLFGAAIVSALAAGFINAMAVAALGVFGALAYLLANGKLSRWQRIAVGVLAALLALALAMHRLPGFANPILISSMRFTADATAFTQSANFDKGAVGLILLALLCRRCSTGAESLAMLRRTLPVAALAAVVVLGLSVGVGLVAPAFKLPAYTPIFLATNLLFTCVAEEAFFRGFLQDRLAAALPATRAWQAGTVLASGILFGLVHLGGGPVYAALATLCGLGYAYAYAATRRIEAPIIVHFAFNAIHFIGFTYPALAPVQ